VYALARDRNEREIRPLIPDAVLEKPPSAELRPDQRDSDSLPDYAELDPIVEGYVEGDRSVHELAEEGYDPELVRRYPLALISPPAHSFLNSTFVNVMSLRRAAGKPMYFLGVGVSETDSLRDERGRAVLDYATRVWARDTRSADALAAVCEPGKVRLAADLAHLCLRGLPPPGAPEPDVTGYVLNFEDPHQFRREALCAFIEAMPPERFQRWLVQEVRPLEGSEMEIWANLPGRYRQHRGRYHELHIFQRDRVHRGNIINVDVLLENRLLNRRDQPIGLRDPLLILGLPRKKRSADRKRALPIFRAQILIAAAHR